MLCSHANNTWNKRLLGWMIATTFILTVGACGGGSGSSNVGNQNDQHPPTALASAIGLSTDASAPSKTFTARANTDVVISAKDSSGPDAPILTFTWSQTAGDPVELVARAADTVVFHTPNVNTVTAYTFKLTVTDANQKTDSDVVSINVLPVDDVNQFLTNPAAPSSRLRILAALQGGENTGVNDQPFSITATTFAHWRNRLGELDQIEVYSETLDSIFPKNFSPSLNYLPLNDAKNPTLFFNLHMLNVEEINSQFDTSELDRRLSASELSSAFLEVQLAVNGSVGVNFELFAIDNYGAIIDGANILTPENTLLTFNSSPIKSLLISSYAAFPITSATNGALLQTWNGEFGASLLTDPTLAELGLENSISASNYYRLIDPMDRFTQLQSWLDYAGFGGTHDQPTEASNSAHAVFFNNYDLGFGRNLWMRSDANGNVYSYVTNFPSVEAVLECRQDFAVFAMEYSSNPDQNSSNAKIAKFYAFKPDPLTGNYIRTNSVNIDGRGERMIPGVCTACHQSYIDGRQFVDASEADLNASFIPLDLDSYLYAKAQHSAQVEPTLNALKFSAQELTQHSREAQEADFQKINATILTTYLDDPARHATASQLIRGWYGDNTQSSQLANSPYDGSYIQPGWSAQEDLYENVFKRNCRTCHTQLGDTAIDFDSYSEFVSNQNLVSHVYEKGIMPLSKITLDRFWVDFYGRESSAALLRTHLATLGQTVPTSPGLPIPVFTFSNQTPSTGEVVTLDASGSTFASGYAWSLILPNGSAAALNNTTGPTSSFTPDIESASYEVVLTVTNNKDQTAALSQSVIAQSLTPSNLVANSVGPLQIDLSWSPPSGPVDSYNIYVNGDPSPTYSVLAPVTTFSDVELTSGEQTIYWVTAVLQGFESIPSAPAIGYTYPLPPANLVGTPLQTGMEIDMSWDPEYCNGPLSYNLNLIGITSVATNNTLYTVTGLNPSTAYNFTIESICNGLNSGPSPIVNVMTAPGG